MSGSRSRSEKSFIFSHILIVCSLLWLISFCLYLPSLRFGFINFDDYTVLLAHPNLYDETSLISSLKEILITSFPREEPLILRDITWALDSYLFGFKNPFGYHLTNVILNSWNSVLLWVFLYATTNRMVFALIVAISFSLLPIHVEPVCWVMGRKDLLVTFFMLSGLTLQTFFLEAENPLLKRILYLLTILITLAALLSKINALTYFLVLAAHQLFYPFLKGIQPSEGNIALWRHLKEIVPRIIPHLIISLLIFIWYKQIISAWGVLDRGIDSFSVEHLTNVVAFTPIILALYLKLILVPFNHSVYYGWPSIHQPLSGGQILFSPTFFIFFIFFSAILFRKRKDCFFYLLTFVLLMVPYFNIMYIGIWITNRYAYFSSFCVVAIIAGFLIDLAKTHGRYAKIGIFSFWIFFILLCGIQTWRYQQVWRSDHNLWKYEVTLENPSLMAYASLANSYLQIGQRSIENEEQLKMYREAESVLERGFEQFESSGMKETTPHLFQLYYLQGLLAQLKEKDFNQQLEFFQKAYDLKPDQKDVVRKMAEIHYRLAKQEELEGQKRALAKQSFDYFSRYIFLIRHQDSSLQSAISLLGKAYQPNFPYLEPSIHMLKEEIQEYLSR